MILLYKFVDIVIFNLIIALINYVLYYYNTQYLIALDLL
jgi:hypothetical protein